MLNVRDFGAVGDGISDDTAPFQAAIDAADAAGGGQVFAPADPYAISQIRLKSRVSLIGEEGWYTRIKALPGSTQHCIVLDSPSTVWTTLSDLALIGDKLNHPVPIDAINYEGEDGTPAFAKHHMLRRLQVNGWSGNGITFATAKLGDSSILDSFFYSNDGCGIWMGSYDVVMQNLMVALSGLTGVDLMMGSCNLFNIQSIWSGQVDPSRGHAFHITNRGSHLVGCQGQDSQGHQFYLDHCWSALISSSMCTSGHAGSYVLDGCRDCRIDGIATTGEGGILQSSIVQLLNSPTANMVDVVFDPACLAPGGVPVSGSTAGNKICVGLVAPASIVYDPPNLPKGTQTMVSVPVPGVAVGDVVCAGFSQDLQGLQLTAYVSAADTVVCVLRNGTNGNVNLGSGILSVKMLR